MQNQKSEYFLQIFDMWIVEEISEKSVKFRQKLVKFQYESARTLNNFDDVVWKICQKMRFFWRKFLKYWGLSGAKACKSCRSHQKLSNEYFHAKFGVDTGENEPSKVCSFQKNWLKNRSKVRYRTFQLSFPPLAISFRVRAAARAESLTSLKKKQRPRVA